MHACLGVTCHLHFWHNDRSPLVLPSTEVTQGWSGHRISISTQSLPWRRRFSCRSCLGLNLQPFDHEQRSMNTLNQSPPFVMGFFLNCPPGSCTYSESFKQTKAAVRNVENEVEQWWDSRLHDGQHLWPGCHTMGKNASLLHSCHTKDYISLSSLSLVKADLMIWLMQKKHSFFLSTTLSLSPPSLCPSFSPSSLYLSLQSTLSLFLKVWRCDLNVDHHHHTIGCTYTNLSCKKGLMMWLMQ